MNMDRAIELERWAQALRTEIPLAAAIETVKERMRTAAKEDDYQLALILKSMLVEARREIEASRLLDEKISSMPDDVRFPIEKASLYFYFLNDPEQALELIDEALSRARRTGFFHREALGVKARILLQLGRGAALSQTLEDIMSLEVIHGAPDVGKERDFIDRAPPGLILEDTLVRYNVFCPRRDAR